MITQARLASRTVFRQFVQGSYLLVPIAALVLGAQVAVGRAEAPRVLPPGKVPNDIRLQPLKDLEGYFPFTPYRTAEEWSKRSERVRRQILVALGLWPMPTK